MRHQDLVDRYLKNSTCSARERAELELAIWQSSDENKRIIHDMDAFLRGCLGGSGYSRNQTLLSAGDLANPLWHLIDTNKVTPRAGYEMLRRARQIAKDTERSLDAQAIQAAVDEFNAGVRSVTPRIPRTAKTTKTQKRAREDTVINSESKHFWSHLREQLAQYVMPALTAVDSGQRERVFCDIDAEFAIFQARISACVSPVVNGTPTRAKIVAACETLGVSVPRVGQPIDLKQARRKMHALAREYHPDHHDNDGRKATLYRRTMDAFEVLQRAAA